MVDVEHPEDIKEDMKRPRQGKISPEDPLKVDLETLVARCEMLDEIEQVAIISASDVIPDEHVEWGCQAPYCMAVNIDPHCPPQTHQAKALSKEIQNFRLGFVIRMTEDSSQDQIIVDRTRIRAVEMGYKDAVGFLASSCTVCNALTAQCMERFDSPGFVLCSVLNDKGCRHFQSSKPDPDNAPSDNVRNLHPFGWDMKAVDEASVSPAGVPCESTVGLILVS